MNLASPPKFRRLNMVLLIILAVTAAITFGIGLLGSWLDWKQWDSFFAMIWGLTAFVALITAILGIPFSLAGFVCSRKEFCALLTAGLNCLASIAVLGLFIGAYFAFNNGLKDIYSSASAAQLVIEHMRTNEGRWPRNWDELHQTYSKMERPPWYPWEDLKDRVEIDFNVDPVRLAQIESDGTEPPFCVIRARRKVEQYPGTIEPNQRILDYLQSKHLRQDFDGEVKERMKNTVESLTSEDSPGDHR